MTEPISIPVTPLVIHLGPGESIAQALNRGVSMATKFKENETIHVPAGVSIIGSTARQTRIIERRTSGIPFL
jgi:hypothetical protein